MYFTSWLNFKISCQLCDVHWKCRIKVMFGSNMLHIFMRRGQDCAVGNEGQCKKYVLTNDYAIIMYGTWKGIWYQWVILQISLFSIGHKMYTMKFWLIVRTKWNRRMKKHMQKDQMWMIIHTCKSESYM